MNFQSEVRKTENLEFFVEQTNYPGSSILGSSYKLTTRNGYEIKGFLIPLPFSNTQDGYPK